MNQHQPPPPPAGLALADIYYVLFRRKGIIIGCCIFAVIAALGVYALWPKKYYSEAKLYISYVVESKAPSQGGTDATIREVGGQGDIINDEMEILHSYDLALEVASNIGPREILGKAVAGNDLDDAATLIQRTLQAEVPKGSTVITIAFQHSNPNLVQPVLSQVIQSYLRRHSEIHHPIGEFEEFLTKETDQQRINLSDLDDQLQRKMASANIVSLDDSKKDFDGQIAKLHQQINDAREDLAEHQASAEALANLIATKTASFAAPASSNLSAGIGRTNLATHPDLALSNPPTSAQIAEYRRLREALDAQRKQENDLKIHFRGQYTPLQALEGEIADTQSNLTKLETEAPELASIKSALSQPSMVQSSAEPAFGADPLAALRAQWETEVLKVTAIRARTNSLYDSLNRVQQGASVLASLEAPISDLVRKRQIAETNYQHFATSLEQAGVDLLLGPGKAPNIQPLEKPMPPRVVYAKVLKVTAGVFAGFVVLGIVLAFGIEMYFDRTYKHPKELEGKLGFPFLISIPWTNGGGKGRVLNQPKIGGLLAQGNSASSADLQTSAANRLSVEAAKSDSALQPFYETLRDRMVSYFEALNLTHKPKLVAVTACHPGAGTTRTAAGLAASLSEIGDGNVLLVDMNGQDGHAHRFYNGKLACDIGEAMGKEKRADALVQENLYVAREIPTSDKLSRGLPKRFSHLVPIMKASDYDYIIFDMPPVSQISITPRLAGFMDIVLLVVESEQTDREVAERALGLLKEAKANVGIILNKRRSYVPQRILPEL